MMPYLDALAEAVAVAGVDAPALVLDQDRFRDNAARLRTAFPHAALRIADKSLPSPDLLHEAAQMLATRRFMSFHLPLTARLLEQFPDADVLMGKPMPIGALARFIDDHSGAGQITWLADSADRIGELRDLASQKGQALNVALEVDIGLGRGGFREPDAIAAIVRDMPPLKIRGIMGYEAHVAALPKFLGGGHRARDRAFALLARFRDALGPQPDLLVNTAGSGTIMDLGDAVPANDFTAGSLLVKPSDFDQPANQAFEPALFIATPVLKTGPHGLPGHPHLSALLRKSRLIRSRIGFSYGGKWMANPVWPEGLAASPFYGLSSNQQGFTLPNGTAAGSHFVLRPTQSEAVIQHFPRMLILSGGRIVGEMAVFPVS